MLPFERKAAVSVNQALVSVWEEKERLLDDRPVSLGVILRVEELEEIIDLLIMVRSHIDTHGEVPWLTQTPLPF